ncbi:alpha/beta hydrolase [Nocardia niigatensis]
MKTALVHRILGLCFCAVMVLAAVTASVLAVGPSARAESLQMRPGELQLLWVPSSMGPVPVQVRWAARGGSAAAYLLDGMRARDDSNAWSTETQALQYFSNDDVTLVMPVGGGGSWYADWAGPVTDHGRPVRWRWSQFLTSELPDYLAQYGVSATGNAIVGLSMSGSAALTLAAHHRDQFAYVASFSGLLDWQTPLMQDAVRAATLSAGVDPDQLAAPGSPAWNALDPITCAPQLAGLSLYISAASGMPGPADLASSQSAGTGAIDGAGLEMVTAASTHTFQARLASLGIPATFDFPATGTHNWRNWDRELTEARPSLLAALDLPAGEH